MGAGDTRMEASMTDQREHNLEYTSRYIEGSEMVYGKGFLSPGGAEEVARILEGISIAGKSVLDVGCGVGGANVLLARDYDTKRVLGIDVEQELVDHATARAAEEGLSDRLFFKLVQPGPLPIEDAAFDVVFSKDAVCHIPDKLAAYAEILRVLRPDGPFVGSDWLKGFDGPLSKDMLYYCEMEGVSFHFETMENTARALRQAGFVGVSLRTRNDWYRDVARREYEMLKGPLYSRMVELQGKEDADWVVEGWRAMVVVLEKGELCPSHIRAWKPGVARPLQHDQATQRARLSTARA